MHGGHHTHFTKCTYVWWAPYTLHQIYPCMVGTIHNSPNVLMYGGHHTHLTKCTYVWWAPYTLHQIKFTYVWWVPYTLHQNYPCMVGTIHTSPGVPMYGGHHTAWIGSLHWPEWDSSGHMGLLTSPCGYFSPRFGTHLTIKAYFLHICVYNT